MDIKNPGKEGRKARDDEMRLWQTVTRDVKIQEKTDLKVKVSKAPARKKKSKDPVQLQYQIPEKSGGADRKTSERLRKGKMPIDRRIDMHGMTQDQALETLRNVIVDAYETGQRLVLVITGKGGGEEQAAHWTDPQPGVLKRRLPEWLKTPPFDRIILETAPAKHRDGGQGAFYILLRRKRG
jgi:DNA-nicking Smr family endonuclease